MKRILWILSILIVLCGCGGIFENSDVSAEILPEQTNESWGVSALPEFTAVPIASSVPASDVEPEPTPVSVDSLRDLADAEIPVFLNGAQLNGLVVSDIAIINTAEICAQWPWFQRQELTDGAAFTLENGETVELPCTEVNGENSSQLQYDGSGCICFQGRLDTEYWLPARWISEVFDMNLLWDAEQRQVFLTTKTNKSAIPQGKSVPVLMYHAVRDDPWGIDELFVTTENMRQQIAYLQENGYDLILFSDLDHLSDYDKPILLTFDDGYDDNYTQLLPILKEYQAKATVFVITGLLGTEHYMTAEQTRELSDSGLVDIQSHTVDHHELSSLSREDQEYQMVQSRLDVARITGKIPNVIAYPTGKRNDDTLSLAEQYYEFGIDMNGGLWTIENDYYKVDRIYVSRYTGLGDFKAKIP